MAQAESRRSREIMTALRAKGIFCFKIHGSALMMAGLPDVIACPQGRFVALETKMPTKRSNTSVRQEYVHSLIRQSGGVALVVCSIPEALIACERAVQDPNWNGEN